MYVSYNRELSYCCITTFTYVKDGNTSSTTIISLKWFVMESDYAAKYLSKLKHEAFVAVWGPGQTHNSHTHTHINRDNLCLWVGWLLVAGQWYTGLSEAGLSLIWSQWICLTSPSVKPACPQVLIYSWFVGCLCQSQALLRPRWDVYYSKRTHTLTLTHTHAHKEGMHRFTCR